MKKRKQKVFLEKRIQFAEGFLVWLKKHHDKFLLLFTFVVMANVFFLIVFGGYSSVSKLVLASQGFLESKIRNESVGHFIATRKVVRSISPRLENIEVELGWPKNDPWLAGEKREALLSQLQRLDEAAYDLEWVANEYFTDYSIQYYPYATGGLASYIYETRHLKRAIDRFLRIAEIAIVQDSFDKRQIEVIEAELSEVKVYLVNLAKFEKELNLLNGNGCGEEGFHNLKISQKIK